MNYDEDFNLALKSEKEYTDQFKPIIDEFEKIKVVLQEKFVTEESVSKKETVLVKPKWFWQKHTKHEVVHFTKEEKPYFDKVAIVREFTFDDHPYILIDINGYNYIMSIGKVGQFKDKLFIIPGSTSKKDEHSLMVNGNGYVRWYFYNSEKITTVQFFSRIIRYFNKYLKSN
jgi:hypothetical protein